MVKYEKRKNIVIGSIMYAVMLVSYIISTILVTIDIFRLVSASTVIGLVGSFLGVAVIIAAFVVMMVKKRQNGFGVALYLILSAFGTFMGSAGSIINELISVVKYGYDFPPAIITLTLFNSLSGFLLLIPAVLVIVFFFKPNTPLKITSAVFVIIAFLLVAFANISSLVNYLSYYNGIRDYSSGDFYIGETIFNYVRLFVGNTAIYSLIVVQIFRSFKKVGTPAAVNTYNQPLASQPAVPVVQSAAPVQNSGVSKETVITNYGNLLKQGLITQEQYDEKLKELFG